MPRGDGSNIAHSAITDHRIPRRPDRPDPAPRSDPAPLSLVVFPPDQADSGDPRDLGLVLAEIADRPYPEPVRRVVAHRAVGLLREAVAGAPDDLLALQELAIALWRDQAPGEALATLERVLQQAPRRELTLEKAARVAMELGDNELSIAYWRRCIEVNPYSEEAHASLAQCLAFRREWAAAAAEGRAALRLDPFDYRTRMLLINCLVRAGEKEQARAEFDTLLAFHPPDPDGLRRWFDELLPPRR
jgi:tetratricopeptide (TPR) repeat protein